MWWFLKDFLLVKLDIFTWLITLIKDIPCASHNSQPVWHITCGNYIHCHSIMSYFSRLEDFTKRSNSDSVLSSAVTNTLSELEKQLLKSHEVVTVRGKRSRPVPILIPPDLVGPMKRLANQDIRNRAGIKTSNPYLFANTGRCIVEVHFVIANIWFYPDNWFSTFFHSNEDCAIRCNI